MCKWYMIQQVSLVFFWSLPILRGSLKQRIKEARLAEASWTTDDPQRFYITRIKWARRLTSMGLKSARDWVVYNYPEYTDRKAWVRKTTFFEAIKGKSKIYEP